MFLFHCSQCKDCTNTTGWFQSQGLQQILAFVVKLHFRFEICQPSPLFSLSCLLQGQLCHGQPDYGGLEGVHAQL